MKTAEEWQCSGVGFVHKDIIKQIQLDAYRAGMTEAAESRKTYYPLRSRQEGNNMIKCVKCGVPAAFQNIHSEPWTCVECQPQLPNEPTELHKSDCSTNNEPAFPNGECDCGQIQTELQKAIFQADIMLDIASKFAFRSGEVMYDTLRELLSAAKQLEALQKENEGLKFLLENANEAVSLKSPEFEWSSAFVRLYQETKQERDSLKSELEKWKKGCLVNADNAKDALRKSDEQRLDILSLKSTLKTCGVTLRGISQLCEYRFMQDQLHLAELCMNEANQTLSDPRVQQALESNPPIN